ncbi:hypothetical protein ACFWP3_40335 [Streptomyces sp. NPDC058525]|uniref:hypothetical protein n=1 Tax=Streptomyces sp. NPDC058525 TaxID=3346538 RepID=UPI0036542793
MKISYSQATSSTATPVVEQLRADDLRLPAGSCKEIFDWCPPAARSVRTLSPCTRDAGHPGSHTNEHGTSWSSDTQNRATPSAPEHRSTLVTNRTDATRRALMDAHRARMEAQQRGVQLPVTSWGAVATPNQSKPVSAGLQAAKLASQGFGTGWSTPQLVTVIANLAEAGKSMGAHIRRRNARVSHTRHAQLEHINYLAYAANLSLVPGVTNLAGQQAAAEKLRAAIWKLASELAADERTSAKTAVLAKTEKLQQQAPRKPHPWFPGQSVA